MKKTLWIICTLVVGSFSAFAHSEQMHDTPSEIVNVYELKQIDFNEILRGNKPGTAVFFPKGLRIPVECFFNGDLIKLTEEQAEAGVLELQQDLYITFTSDEPYFSLDLKEWKTYLEFVTGQWSAYLSIIDNEALKIVVGSEMNQRKIINE